MWKQAATNETTTAVRDSSERSSSTTEASAQGESGEASSADQHPESKADGSSSQPATKDVIALRSLDAYFEKLKGPEKKEEQQPPPVVAQAAASATASAPAGQSTRAPEATSSKPEAGPQDAQQTKDMDEVMELLQKILDSQSKDTPGQAKGQEQKGPQPEMKIVSLNVPSEYQRWLDAQLSINPPTALNILLAINVAVFLFELASPEAVPGLIVTSLPSLLGAKVNALIAAGEWWRLVTPMFLHAGFFHILLSSAVLLAIGPSVEVAYGSFGFLAAFLTGGVYGNLMSFLQTADVTVGGTGPIYGLVGAYLVYLWKNKDAIGKDDAEGSFWSLIFFAALNVAIGSSLPIDDWTHIGAALGGVFFGALAAPTLKRMPIGFSKLQDVIKAEVEKDGGKIVGSEGSASSSSGSDGRRKSSDVEPGGTLFLLEGPGPKRQAWIMAACLGAAALLLQLSTTGIPQDLLDVSSQITTI